MKCKGYQNIVRNETIFVKAPDVSNNMRQNSFKPICHNMECFYDNQSTAEEKRDTKVEEIFFFSFFGAKGNWLAAGEL